MNHTKIKRTQLIHHHLQQRLDKITSSEYLKILLLRTVGNFLVLSSLFMAAKTFYQPAREEIKYLVNRITNKQYVVAVPARQGKDDMKFRLDDSKKGKGFLAQNFKINQVEVINPEDPNFSIVIPKIGANARILANVNAANETEYLEALQQGVAHTGGTAFPGEGGHIFLFAHSTDYFWNVGTYNAVFYLLYKLEKEDEVDLFYKGQRYVYKIIGKEIVDPSRVEYLTRKTNKEFLTLQTCWPPGTTLKRLLLFATRVSE